MAVAIHEATPAAEALLSSVLRCGVSLAPDYPLVFGERAPGSLVTVDDDGQPLAGCAILPRVFQVGATRLPVGLIGSVATAPEHRGRGHASRVLQRAQAALADAGCALALLWADDAEFYSGRGWSPMGTEINHVLPKEISVYLPQASNVRVTRAEDVPALHALYASHSTHVERSMTESEALLGIPDVNTLVLEREGVACAYVSLGRGADLAGVLHEWAGAPLDVLALVRAHLERSASGLVLMSPRDAIGVFRYLQVLGIPARVGVLGMGKLVSPEAAASVLRGLCPAATIEPLDDGLRLIGPRGQVDLDATQTLLLLAAPRGLSEVVDATADLTGLDLEGLPLSPFCWGLDSI